MSKTLTARLELVGAAQNAGWTVHDAGTGQRKNGQDYAKGLQLFKTVHLVRFTGGERDASITVEFTETGGYVTGTYQAYGSATWKRMTKAEVLGQLLAHGPLAIARREAEQARRRADSAEAKYAANVEREAERSAERTRLQGAVYNLVNDLQAAVAVTDANGTRYVERSKRDIATEIVCLLQQDDSPLVALVDAWRSHKAAEAGVRADALERQALAEKAARWAQKSGAMDAAAEINALAAREA